MSPAFGGGGSLVIADLKRKEQDNHAKKIFIRYKIINIDSPLGYIKLTFGIISD